MIAKAAPIAHGANAIRYSVNKDRADIVKANLIPEDISPDAMYQRMMLNCKQFMPKIRRGSPMKDFVIRIELSPTAKETAGWTLTEWGKLADEFIRDFDSIDLSKRTKRKSSKRTNCQNSQYVASLHRDSKSGILHLHIDVCRIDIHGNMNSGNLIGTRAKMAPNIINERRGWVQSETISEHHKKEISDRCMAILGGMEKFDWNVYEREMKKAGYDIKFLRNDKGVVCGYSIKRGNSVYKASKLGVGRNLVPSKIIATWQKLHPQQDNAQLQNPAAPKTRTATASSASPVQKPKPVSHSVMKHYDIVTNDHRTWHIDLPDFAADIIRQECSLEDAHPWAKIEEVQHTAMLLFAGYLDAATSMAESSGGGGSSPESGWGKDKDEDDREWAHRCARMANRMCKWSKKKGMSR